MMQFLNLVLEGAGIEGEAAAHVRVEITPLRKQSRNPSESRESAMTRALQGVREASKQSRNPCEFREAAMIRALRGDVAIVPGEVQVGETSRQSRNPMESRQPSMTRAVRGDVVSVVGQVQVGEASKQNRNPSESRQSDMTRALRGDVTIGAGEAQAVGETVTVKNRTPCEFCYPLLNRALRVDDKIVAEEVQLEETSKQDRNRSVSRESVRNRALRGDVTILAGEREVGETSKGSRNPTEFHQSSMTRALRGDDTIVPGEAQAVDETITVKNRHPCEYRDSSLNHALRGNATNVAGEVQLGETSKQGRNRSESRESAMTRVLRGDAIIVAGEAQVGGTSKQSRSPSVSRGRNVKSIVQIYERNSGSKTTKEIEGEQDFYSTMELARRSPCQKQSAPHGFQQHPASLIPPPSDTLVDVAAKRAGRPPDETNSDVSTKGIQQGIRRVRRKISSSVHKEPDKEVTQADDNVRKEIVLQAVDLARNEMIQAMENASSVLAEAIDRVHSTKLQSTEIKVKLQEHLLNTELDYMKKRDRIVNRNQRYLIKAINGLTNIITTGLKNTASAGDINVEATGQDTLQTVEDSKTQHSVDAQE